jgi:hypothetical protein
MKECPRCYSNQMNEQKRCEWCGFDESAYGQYPSIDNLAQTFAPLFEEAAWGKVIEGLKPYLGKHPEIDCIDAVMKIQHRLVSDDRVGDYIQQLKKIALSEKRHVVRDRDIFGRLMYFVGIHVFEENPKNAIYYFEEGQKVLDFDCTLNLGMMYLHEIGTSKDIKKIESCVEDLKAIVEEGPPIPDFPLSQYYGLLSDYYGYVKDLENHFENTLLAAQKGNYHSQKMIAEYYRTGTAYCEKSFELADYWATQAYKNPNKDFFIKGASLLNKKKV